MLRPTNKTIIFASILGDSHCFSYYYFKTERRDRQIQILLNAFAHLGAESKKMTFENLYAMSFAFMEEDVCCNGNNVTLKKSKVTISCV